MNPSGRRFSVEPIEPARIAEGLVAPIERGLPPDSIEIDAMPPAEIS